MICQRLGGIVAACALLAAGVPAWAEPSAGDRALAAPDPAVVRAAARLMGDLRDHTRRDAERIRAIYADEAARLALADRRALRRALEAGTVARLPAAPAALNLNLRLAGRSPIGEMDLPHQELYVAARPETIACLLEVAARVTSGPIEVTSLVRHLHYQRALAGRNRNARTTVPTHAMGLAFDISILHTAPATAAEIRDVLRAMAAEGKLLFLAEQRQLVFHVVPAPSHRRQYAALYHASTLAPPPTRTPPVALSSLREHALPPGSLLVSALTLPPDERLLPDWWTIVLLAGTLAAFARLTSARVGPTMTP